METQTQTHRMGLNPFLTFYIDVDTNAKANVRCEHTLSSAPDDTHKHTGVDDIFDGCFQLVRDVSHRHEDGKSGEDTRNCVQYGHQRRISTKDNV